MRLTPSSWVKIALIALLCLVLCAGVGGCFSAISRSASTVLRNAVHHRSATYDASEYANVGKAEVAADSVRCIDIDWLAGQVSVAAVDDETCGGMIQVQETTRTGSNAIPERERMRWNLVDGALSIVYGDGDFLGSGGLFGCSPDSCKMLSVTIPRSYAHELDRLDVTGASGHYDLLDVGAEHIEADLASGELTGSGLTAKTLELDIASGRVGLEGAFADRVSCDVMSGNVDLTCTEQRPNAADISLASGSFHLSTPPDSGYTVSVERTSGNFACPRGQQRNGVYVARDGSASFSVDMTSGNATID